MTNIFTHFSFGPDQFIRKIASPRVTELAPDTLESDLTDDAVILISSDEITLIENED